MVRKLSQAIISTPKSWPNGVGSYRKLNLRLRLARALPTLFLGPKKVSEGIFFCENAVNPATLFIRLNFYYPSRIRNEDPLYLGKTKFVLDYKVKSTTFFNC